MSHESVESDAELPETGKRSVSPKMDEDCANQRLATGQTIGDFRIVRMLGSGSFATVYLARELSLDRLVALKISGNTGTEGEALARLDHPNIVLVHSQQVTGGRKLIAMRYVAGRTLADWASSCWPIDRTSWRGHDLLVWLRAATAAAESSPLPPQPGFERLPYVPAMCRLVRDLARGLDHAHRQGVVHRDVKPANVLVDSSGRALLMDFNVARRTAEDSPPTKDSVGGTLAYMAPEHLAAFLPALPSDLDTVDGRADVYSLGILFYELLAGCHPWPSQEAHGSTSAVRSVYAQRLRGVPTWPPESAQHVSPGLRSIVGRCLAPSPVDRYQSAAELAEDLTRWLENRLLAHAPDPSLSERIAKRCRRHARAAAVAASLLVLVAAVAGAVVARADWRRLDTAAARVDASRTQLESGAARQASTLLSEASGMLSTENLLLPESWTIERRQQVHDQLTELAGRVAAEEAIRFQAALDSERTAATTSDAARHPLDPLAVFGVLTRRNWEHGPVFRGLSDEARVETSEDITELLLGRVLAIVGEESQEQDNAHRLDLLARVPAAHRDSAVVQAVRDSIGARDRDTIATERLVASCQTSLDAYLAGMIAARRGQDAAAIDLFNRSVDLRQPSARPRFWSHFVRAHCYGQLGHHEEAIAGYSVCVGLRPTFAWSYHNLGIIYTQMGDYELAVRHFEQAIEREPTLAAAHANLGVALFQRGEFADSCARLDKAIALDGASAEVYLNRAAARAALNDIEGAQADLNQALAVDPDFELARENLRQLQEAAEGRPAQRQE